MVGWDSKPTPYHHGYPKRSRWWPDSEGDWHDSDWREGGWQTCANPEPKENKDKDVKASAAWEKEVLGLDSKPAPYQQGYKKEKRSRQHYSEKKKGDMHDSEGREGGCKTDANPEPTRRKKKDSPAGQTAPFEQVQAELERTLDTSFATTETEQQNERRFIEKNQDEEVDDEWSNEPAWKVRADRVRKMAYKSGRCQMGDSSCEQRMVTQQDDDEADVPEADAPEATSGPILLTMAEVRGSLAAEGLLTNAEARGSLAAQMARKQAEEEKRQQDKSRHLTRSQNASKNTQRGQEESLVDLTGNPKGSLGRLVARRGPALDTDSPPDDDSPVPSDELTVPSMSEDETAEKGTPRLSQLKTIRNKAEKGGRLDQRPPPEVAPETKPRHNIDDANIDEPDIKLQVQRPEEAPEKKCDKDIDDDNIDKEVSRSESL